MEEIVETVFKWLVYIGLLGLIAIGIRHVLFCAISVAYGIKCGIRRAVTDIRTNIKEKRMNEKECIKPFNKLLAKQGYTKIESNNYYVLIEQDKLPDMLAYKIVSVPSLTGEHEIGVVSFFEFKALHFAKGEAKIVFRRGQIVCHRRIASISSIVFMHEGMLYVVPSEKVLSQWRCERLNEIIVPPLESLADFAYSVKAL